MHGSTLTTEGVTVETGAGDWGGRVEVGDGFGVVDGVAAVEDGVVAGVEDGSGAVGDGVAVAAVAEAVGVVVAGSGTASCGAGRHRWWR